ncbi:MAG: hypothetical protein NZ602_04470 [Thermoguttaceae bacterium]|nr:hypothetical protein [Thermoguttaceae bacterium]MDW8039536.1 hypothetical protein [Thermoguttaceae bacterium]
MPAEFLGYMENGWATLIETAPFCPSLSVSFAPWQGKDYGTLNNSMKLCLSWKTGKIGYLLARRSLFRHSTLTNEDGGRGLP